jgi:UDP-N-acetylmuramoylalanine--D-glutamate ligase
MKLILNVKDIPGLRVTIMGLGLHGGGIESALFFARNGAKVTVTDQKNEEQLASSIEKLAGFPIRFVLGRHENRDFIDTDLVIKNPGVPKKSTFIQMALSCGVSVETDISVFASISKNPLICVTGSKGKSTVASAIHHIQKAVNPDAKLGGNITISPLSFLTTIPPDAPVTLELSSWQLADLETTATLKPRVTIITNILPDHMNWYKNMEDYVRDKKIIFKNQTSEDYSIFNLDDERLKGLASESKAESFYFSSSRLPNGMKGAWLDGASGVIDTGKGDEETLFETVALKGVHNKINLLAAGLACALFGVDSASIRESLEAFPGIEHRLELFFEKNGVSYYNDSAATIPHATAAALTSLKKPVYLITGGTDKNIDFGPLLDSAALPERIYLLAGSATEKIEQGFKDRGIVYHGPFGSLEETVEKAIRDSHAGVSILFSPACASFGMFLNEFDRGRKFKACVIEMLGKKTL